MSLQVLSTFDDLNVLILHESSYSNKFDEFSGCFGYTPIVSLSILIIPQLDGESAEIFVLGIGSPDGLKEFDDWTKLGCTL